GKRRERRTCHPHTPNLGFWTVRRKANCSINDDSNRSLVYARNTDLLDNGDREVKRLLPLAAIEIFVWLFLLGSTYVISKGAFAINFGTATLVESVATQTARVTASGGVVIIWLLGWKKVTDWYQVRTLSRKRANV